MDTATQSLQAPRRPIIIQLWRRRVHLLTAHLVLDLCERRLCHQEVEELADAYAFAVVATDDDGRILATALNRRFPSEAAVASLDRAVEVLAGQDRIGRADYWKHASERVVVLTGNGSPFSSARFASAIEELGCAHRFRRR